MIGRESLWWARHGTRLRITHIDEPADHWFRPLTMNEYAQWVGIQTGVFHATSITYEFEARNRRDAPLEHFTNTYRNTEWHDDGTITREEYAQR